MAPYFETHDFAMLYYRKNPQISDTRKFAVITLKAELDGFFLKAMHPKNAEGIANSLIWVCTVCPELSVRKVRIITVGIDSVEEGHII